MSFPFARSVSGGAYLTAVTWCEVCVWVSLCRVERLTTVTCRVAVRTTRRTRLRPSPTTTTIGGGFLSLSYCKKDSPPLSSRDDGTGTGRCLRLLWQCLLLLLLVLDMIRAGTGDCNSDVAFDALFPLETIEMKHFTVTIPRERLVWSGRARADRRGYTFDFTFRRFVCLTSAVVVLFEDWLSFVSFISKSISSLYCRVVALLICI